MSTTSQTVPRDRGAESHSDGPLKALECESGPENPDWEMEWVEGGVSKKLGRFNETGLRGWGCSGQRTRPGGSWRVNSQWPLPMDRGTILCSEGSQILSLMGCHSLRWLPTSSRVSHSQPTCMGKCGGPGSHSPGCS